MRLSIKTSLIARHSRRCSRISKQQSFAWVRIPGRIGHRAPHDNSGRHDRIRTSSPWQQPRRSVRLLKRQWRGPDGTKSDVVRTLQGRRRERAAREGLCERFHFPARVHLPSGAAAGAEFRLPPITRNLSGISGAPARSFEPTTWPEPWCMSRCGKQRNVGNSFSRTATSKPLSSSACSKHSAGGAASEQSSGRSCSSVAFTQERAGNQKTGKIVVSATMLVSEAN
jgi:hypothetical protein